ncbi:hypothetical protein B0O80DRAFT_268111 [Mortierella sp. GBAus27b]|nr:hypothetical protein B0O80DRAFT_268111 [Mortierella sp. GBAus27b]
MSARTTPHRNETHALDALLQNTLQLHHRILVPNNNSSHHHTPDSSPHQPPLIHSTPASPRSSHLSTHSLAPSALTPDSLDSSPVRRPPKSALRKKQHAMGLNLNGLAATAPSSPDVGVDTSLTRSSFTSPARSLSPDVTASSPISPLPSPSVKTRLSSYPSAESLPRSTPTVSYSRTTSPTSSNSPTSPLRRAFSSSKNHRRDPTVDDSTTFSACYNQLDPDSKQQYKEQLMSQEQERRDQEQGQNPNTETPHRIRSYSQSQLQPRLLLTQDGLLRQPSLLRKSSLTAANLHGRHAQSRFSHQHQPSLGQGNSTEAVQQLFRSKSNGHMSSSRHRRPEYADSHIDLSPKLDSTSVISIHVRYVPKDLWVQIDLPRDIPVHKARDMILAKCRLNSNPLQSRSTTPSDLDTGASGTRDESILSRNYSYETTLDVQQGRSGVKGHQRHLSVENTTVEGSSASVSPSRSRRPSRTGLEDDSFNDQESIDDDEAELQAEELMADDMFPETPPSRASLGGSGFRESLLQGLRAADIGPPRVVQNNHQRMSSQPVHSFSSIGSGGGDGTLASTTGPYIEEQATLNHQQLQRLISYSMLHKNNRSRSSSAGDATSGWRDGSGMSATKSRISSHIPGWSHYKSRQTSQNARQMVREVLEHGGVLADSYGTDEGPQTEMRMSECSAWKACFGLFWVAAGHWLDDSRLVSSYHLQPHCLLELQLRNNYIQLPPPGTSLNYYDHYAEGVLYKASKKSHRVTKLTTQGIKDSAGVWKERWVVLQGNKLLIYHKRKDTTKKSIDLHIPLMVDTTVIPQGPRPCFKISSSTVSMSTTMITLTISHDPNVPKVCFRATSESELNHWIRIFNSLSSTSRQGLPLPFDPAVMTSPMVGPIQLPPPLPPLPLDPPPLTLDETAMSTKKRDRHHSFSVTAAAVYGRVSGIGGTAAAGGFSGERKRSQTIQGNYSGTSTPPPPLPGCMPTINPLLISNAAAALSNLHGSDNTGEQSGASEIVSSLGNRGSILQIRRANSTQSCASTCTVTSITKSGSLRRAQMRDSTNSQATLVGSLSRQTSCSSLEKGFDSESRQVSWNGEGLLVRQDMRSMRMRTVTEPGRCLAQEPAAAYGGRVRSLSSHRSSSQTLLREYLQSKEPLSGEATAADGNIAQVNNKDMDMAMDSQLLQDPVCQALLKVSGTRSSAPPLFTGYIWLYIPNPSSATSPRDKGQQELSKDDNNISRRSSRSSMSSKGMTHPAPLPSGAAAPATGSLPMASTWPSGERAKGVTGIANIRLTKASGRYVKCLVIINALGQFQWAEVNKSEPSSPQQQGQDTTGSTPVNPCYGIRLRPKGSSTSTVKSSQQPSYDEKKMDVANMNTVMLENKEGWSPAVEVSMAHKLRLYFFCIKITLTSLGEVLVEMVDIGTTGPQQPTNSSPAAECGGTQPPNRQSVPPPTKVSRIGLTSRFSAPLAHKRSSTLATPDTSSTPLLPSQTMSMTMQNSAGLLRFRSTNASATGGRMRVSTVATTSSGAPWPSMHPLNERPTPPPTSKEPELAPRPSSLSALSKKDVPKTHSVPATTSETPADIEGLRNQGVPRSLLVKTQSIFAENRPARPSSTSSMSVFRTPGAMSLNMNVSAILKTDDPFLMEKMLSPTVDGATTTTPMVARTSGKMYAPEPRRAAAPMNKLPPSSPPQLSQKDSAVSLTTVSRPSSVLSLAQDLQKAMRKSVIHHPDQSRLDDGNESSSSTGSSRSHKPSLQEITAKKRASAQRQQDDANVAAARLKLIGGVKTLEGTPEQGPTRPQKEQRETVETGLQLLLKQCPFLEEAGSGRDPEGRTFVTLKGYTETEDGWNKLQGALEQFLGGPIKDQRSALPPEDTLIPSYHAPRIPEVRLSAKAQQFLRAKDRAAAAAAAESDAGATTTKDNAYSDPTPTAAMIVASNGLSRANSKSGDGFYPRVRSITSPPTSFTPAGVAEFSRHSVQLASGVGYGPCKSFTDLGSHGQSTLPTTTIATAPNNNTIVNKSLVGISRGFADGYESADEGLGARTRYRSGSGSLMAAGKGAVTGFERVPSSLTMDGQEQEQEQQQQQQQHQRSGSGYIFRNVAELQIMQSKQKLQKRYPHDLGRGYTIGAAAAAVTRTKNTSANLTRWMELATTSV